MQESMRQVGIGVVACLAVLAIVGLWMPDAAARPGTPTELRAWSLNAWSAYFSFKNTATESVGFEWELLANGSPILPNTLDCSFGHSPHWGSGTIEHPACQYTPQLSGAPDRSLKDYGRELVTFSTKLNPATTYCFRVRAREWEGPNRGGRGLSAYQQWGEGLVSELWSSWVCTTTAPTPPAPPAPSKPKLTYFPAVKRAEGNQPDQLVVEWDGELQAPDAGFDIERQGGPGFGFVMKPTGSVYRHVFSNVGEPSPQNRLTFRICNVNRFGRSCSLSTSAYEDVAAQPGSTAASRSTKIGPPVVQSVAPSNYAKVTGQPPEYVQVQVTFAEGVPDKARYTIDDGRRTVTGCQALAGSGVRCWLDAAQLIVSGSTAVVWIPYSAFQQAQQQVQVQLSNKHGESAGTVRVLPVSAQQSPTTKEEVVKPLMTGPKLIPGGSKRFGQ